MPRTRPTTLEPLTPAFFVVLALHAALACAAGWAWKELRAKKQVQPLAWMNPADFHATVPGEPATASPPKAVALRAAPVQRPETKPPAPPPAPAVPKAVPLVAKKTDVEPTPLLPTAPAQLGSSLPTPGMTTPLFGGVTEPKPSANRSITLRRVIPSAAPSPVTGQNPAPPAKNATLADMARLSTLRPAPPEQPRAPTPADPDAGLNMDAVENAVNAAFSAHWTAPPLDAVPENQRSARLTVSIARDGTLTHSQMSAPSGSHALDNSILAAAAAVKKIAATLPSQFVKESYDLELTFLLHP
jgi:hypothetical protein